jgi:oligoendopeptidase F|tara:strand:- start:7 stop:1863 length:1857 start_codon:yes stop_codon:yes gene_type:complete
MFMACTPNDTSNSSAVPLRSEIDDKYKWDLTKVYPSDEAWEEDLKKVKELSPKFADYKGKLLSSSANLLEAIELSEEINQLFGRLFHYSANSLNTDLKNEKYQAMYQRVRNAAIKSGEYSSYYAPEMLEKDYSVVESFMDSEPKLAVYEKSFKDLYLDKPHTLSENEERILTMTGKMSGVPSEAYEIMKSTDYKWGIFKDESGNEVTMSEGRYGKYTSSTNRRVREDMYKALYVPFGNTINTMSVLMKGNVEKNVFYANVRGYNNTLEARLKSAGISTDVYKNLIASVNDNLEPLHRWASIKAKYLGLEKIEPFDTYAPLSEFSRDYTYEEAQEIVKEALMPLGPEIQEIIDMMYNENLIDVFENQGKESGAYQYSVWGVSPYVKLNFSGKLDDVFTLAHELGHAFHSYLSEKNQPYVYSGYNTFNAEVASVTTESLLMDYLMANAQNDQERAVLIQKYIQDIGSTYYRQARFAEFELKIHEAAERGEILTEDFLTTTFGDIYSKYWGPSMQITEEEAFSWARIPHFYRNYYVYAYATSFAAGEKVSERVQNEGQAGIDGFIAFLSSGSSDYPVELLNLAGVDMTTSEPFEAVSRKMNFLMDELEKILEVKSLKDVEL